MKLLMCFRYAKIVSKKRVKMTESRVDSNFHFITKAGRRGNNCFRGKLLAEKELSWKTR